MHRKERTLFLRTYHYFKRLAQPPTHYRLTYLSPARLLLATLVVAWWLLFPSSVKAHDQITSAGSLIAGLTHPVFGPDHLLAMLSVGILSAQIGGRAIWTVPTTFVAVMAAGGLVGVFGADLALNEIGIAISVVALGVAITAKQALPVRIALFFVALFAIFHGNAHGLEIPQAAQPLLYVVGFMFGTAVIHVAGVFIGDIAGHYTAGEKILRFSGLAITLTGVYFILALL